MNFQDPTFHIDPTTYTHIISIGNKCISRMALDELKLSKWSFPFDFIPTSPELILKYLQDFTDFLPEHPGKDRNKDAVWFGHFDLSPQGRSDLLDKFKRRFDRFRTVFSTGGRVLLLYTSEADVYNEMMSRVNQGINYIFIKELVRYLQRTFPTSNFDVLCIHTNDERPHEQVGKTMIYNATIYVAPQHLSLNMETHVSSTIDPYRKTTTHLLRLIFGLE